MNLTFSDSNTVVKASKRQSNKLGIFFWICVLWIVIVILLALFAPLLPLNNPNKTFVCQPLSGPSGSHLLGCDDLGRDILSRIIFGARVSMFVGIVSIAIGLIIGGFFGLISGYNNKKLDTLLNSIANIIISFPTLILLLAIVAIFNHSLIVITLSISFISIPLLFRVIRSATISVSNKDFVQAAKIMGSSKIRILFVEILPNITPIIFVYGCLGIGSAIIAEGTLAFLGLSVSLPTPSWGNMIAEGAQTYLKRDFLLTLWPSLMIIFTVICFNFISQRFESKFNSTEGAI